MFRHTRGNVSVCSWWRRAGQMTARASRGAWGAVAVALAASPGFGCSSIPEGRFAVDDVAISGAEQVDEDAVLDKLATTESPRFLGMFQGMVYDYELYSRATLEQDLRRIRRFYRARGYYDAMVRAARVVRDEDLVTVEIVVVEGQPVKTRQVAIAGLEGLPPEVSQAAQQAARKGMPRGQPFDEDRYRDTQGDIVRALANHGYAYAKASRDAFVDVVHHAAEVVYRIEPDRPATFGELTIRGLGELPDDEVRAVVAIEPGEPFSASQVAEAEQAALELGVFSSVRITPQLADPPPASRVVPLVMDVEPAKLRSVRLGGGIQLDTLRFDIHLRAGWEDRNFLGGMRRFSLDVKPGVVLYPLRIDYWDSLEEALLEARVKAAFQQPGFIEERTTAYVKPRVVVFPVLLKTEPNPDDPLLGYLEVSGELGVERTFWKLYASLGHGIQVDVPFSYRGGLDPSLETLLIAYPQLVTNLDLRDDRIHPHEGLFIGNTLQVATFGDAQDVRINPELRGYIPAHERITIAGRFAVGFLFPFNYGNTVQAQLAHPPATVDSVQAKDLQLLYFRGFFSGGPNSNRGYAPRSISPHGFVPYLSPAGTVANACDAAAAGYDAASCSIPVGGFSLWEASLEVRFRIVGPLLAAVFCDAGDVSAGQGDFRIDHPHLSCGGGLRYDTPVGPIRLDLGYRLTGLQFPEGTDPRIEGDPGTLFGAPMALSFGIGEAF